ncbi:aspartyl protease family protein [Variovorax sp. LARHSF232]
MLRDARAGSGASPHWRRAKSFAIGLVATCALGLAQAEGCSVEQVGTSELIEERGQFNLPVTINGHANAVFLVDTGAENSVVDASLAAELALPERRGTRARQIGVDGVAGPARADVTAAQLAFAGAEHTDLAMAVRTPGAGKAGASRGIVGASLLSRYDVEFDFPAQRLNLYKVKNCDRGSALFKPWRQPYDSVVLEVSPRHILSLPVVVDGKPLTMALDTGATFSTITFDAAVKLGLDIDRLKAKAPRSTSYGVSGSPIDNFTQRFGRVQIGQSAYGAVPLRVAGIHVKPYDGILGLDFLRSRKVWVSYATQQLLVERTPAIPK